MKLPYRNVKTDRFALTPVACLAIVFLALGLCLPGCGDNVKLPDQQQLAEFEKAGPVPLAADVEKIVKARIGGGPYRVVSDDVLELTMPAILQIVTAEESLDIESNVPYVCRVAEDGRITLPVVGKLEVAGKTLAQIESQIVDQYHPKYTVSRPSVFVKVLEYRTIRVSVTGAVNKPGVYDLRSDQTSLVNLLMQAEGIVDRPASTAQMVAPIRGAKAIRIMRAQESEPSDVEKHQTPPDDQAEEESDIRLEFEEHCAGGFVGDLLIEYEGGALIVEGFDLQSQDHREALCQKARELGPEMAEDLRRELAALLKTTETPDNKNASHGAGELEYGKKSSETTDPEHGITSDEEALILPIKGFNIPFADVVLNDGDNVVVEPLELPLFSVLGLVGKPGNFTYPPTARYNLMQALAFAGGLDTTAEPRYVTVYRRKGSDSIVNATFEVVNTSNGSMLTDALAVPIKPGDIVSVEHTPRTRANVALDRLIRVNLGVYARLDDFMGAQN